jgi:hypothetical protein
LKEDMHEAERRGDLAQLSHLQRQFAQLRRAVIGQARTNVGLSPEG